MFPARLVAVSCLALGALVSATPLMTSDKVIQVITDTLQNEAEKFSAPVVSAPKPVGTKTVLIDFAGSTIALGRTS